MHPLHKAISLIHEHPNIVDAFALFLMFAIIGYIMEKIGKANQERKRIEGDGEIEK